MHKLSNTFIFKPYPLPKVSTESAKINDWIRGAGGEPQNRLTEDTTHMVVEARQWKNKSKHVTAALEANESRDKARRIKIVSSDWLHSVLHSKLKVKEGPFLWEKLDPPAKGGDREPKGAMGETLQAFQEATEKFVDPREKRKLEAKFAQKEMNEAAEKMAEQGRIAMERDAETTKRRELASLVKRGVERSAAEIFSDNHHIYVDPTGFSYDVTLTKVDTRANSNERLIVTIYESNTEPHSYATNLHSNGTNKRPSNNMLVTFGAPYRTAFMTFMLAFKEQTGLHWDDRVTGHNARILARKQARESGREAVEEEEQYFRYQPPTYGARGLMAGVVDEVPETVKNVRQRITALSSAREERSEPFDVEEWMSDADGAEIEPRRGSSIAQDGTATEEVELEASAAAAAVVNATVSAETARGGQEQTNAGHVADPMNDYEFDALINDVATAGDLGDLGYPFDSSRQTGGEPCGADPTSGTEAIADPMAVFDRDFGVEQPAMNSQNFDQFMAGNQQQSIGDRAFEPAASGFGGQTSYLEADQFMVANQQQTFGDRASEPAANGFGGQTSFLEANQGSAHAASEPTYQTVAENSAFGAPASSGQEVANGEPSSFTEAFVTVPADQSDAGMAPEPAQENFEDNSIFGWGPVVGQESADANAAFAAFDFGNFNVTHEVPNWDVDATRTAELVAQFDQGLADMPIPQMSEIPEDLHKFAASGATAESGTGLEFLNGANALVKGEEQSQKEVGTVRAEEGDVESAVSSLGKRKREEEDEGGDKITA